MTNNTNHGGFLMQNAGQAVGAALAIEPLPRNIAGGSERVAGRESMSKKTGTAALASFRLGPLSNQRRAPGHLQASVGPRFEDRRYLHPASFVVQEDTMRTSTMLFPIGFQRMFTIIVRVTCSLLLWTLGATAMDLRTPRIQPKEHRVTIAFPADRAKIEQLQRWVNAGHDPWCRDSRMVASETLRHVSPQFADYELSSLNMDVEHAENTMAVYTFHSLDGLTTYRITLRRHLYLLRSAGSLTRIIWIPETAEIITRD
jgi:hypothetical protein